MRVGDVRVRVGDAQLVEVVAVDEVAKTVRVVPYVPRAAPVGPDPDAGEPWTAFRDVVGDDLKPKAGKK